MEIRSEELDTERWGPPQLGAKLVRKKEFGVALGVVCITIVFSLLSEHFLTLRNAASMLTMASELGIVAIGMALLIISGEFDLSVGAVFAFTPLLMALMVVNHSVPMWLALTLALAAAGLLGLINGQITVRTGMPSFVATLGAMMFWRGVVLSVTGGRPVTYFGDSPIRHWLGGDISSGLRASSLWFVLLALVLWFILEKTRYGNWVFATGGNQAHARQLGVPVTRVKQINFVVTSLFAGLAGVLQFARLGSMSPAQGEGLELEAIAAAVLGGASLSGGRGSIAGAFIGALLIGMIRSGLVLVGAPTYWYRSFVGVILILAVVLNMYVNKKGRGE